MENGTCHGHQSRLHPRSKSSILGCNGYSCVVSEMDISMPARGQTSWNGTTPLLKLRNHWLPADTMTSIGLAGTLAVALGVSARPYCVLTRSLRIVFRVPRLRPRFRHKEFANQLSQHHQIQGVCPLS